MPPKNVSLGPGSIFIEGCEFKGIIEGCEFKGISDFNADMSAVEEYVKDEVTKVLYSPGTGTLTTTVRLSKILIMRICGMWDWVIENCPNKRVVHLIRYGKDAKVRWKNFQRGMHIIAKELR